MSSTSAVTGEGLGGGHAAAKFWEDEGRTFLDSHSKGPGKDLYLKSGNQGEAWVPGAKGETEICMFTNVVRGNMDAQKRYRTEKRGDHPGRGSHYDWVLKESVEEWN